MPVSAPVPSVDEEVAVTSMMRRAMLYLGLAPEEDYDDLSASGEGGGGGGGDDNVVHVHRAAEPMAEPTVGGTVARPTAVAGRPAEVSAPGAVRTITREAARASGARVQPVPAGASVKTIPVTHAKPHVVAPDSFNDAQAVADRLKSDQPVIMNLQNVDRDLRRRLIDFASGLSYGLAGRMDRVADGVYLLTPANVEVSDDERRRLQERGLHS